MLKNLNHTDFFLAGCIIMALIVAISMLVFAYGFDSWVFNQMVDEDCAINCYYQCQK